MDRGRARAARTRHGSVWSSCPCAPPTTIARRCETSSREELGAREGVHAAGVWPSTQPPPRPRAARLAADSTSTPETPRPGRSCRARPTRRPRSPPPARSSRTRRDRQPTMSESRRPPCEGKRRHRPPRPAPRARRRRTSAASGLARARTPRYSASAPPLPSKLSTSAGNARERLWSTTTAPPPDSKCRAFSVWWSAVACGYGTRIAGVPAAASSLPSRRRAKSRGSAAASAAPKSSVDSRRNVVAARHAWPRRRSRARPRLWRTAGPSPATPRRANSLSACAPASPPKTASTGRCCGSPNALAPVALGTEMRPQGSGARRRGTSTRRSVDRVREERRVAQKRRGEPVREPEMCVGLCERGRIPRSRAGAPSARRRSRRLRARRRVRRRDRIRQHANGARIACQGRRTSPSRSGAGSQRTAKVSSSKPAQERAATRRGRADPANVTLAPRRAAPPRLREGRT